MPYRAGTRLEERSMNYNQFLVNVLIVIFGLSAWIGVNGIYVQLPLLVITAPEGWSLPVYIVVVVQAANAAPVLYALFLKFAPDLCNESVWIAGLLVLGTTAMGLLAFFHQTTIEINGTDHSAVLLILVFITALVGCSSSVLFLPYLRNFREVHLVSFFVGEGLSGLLPSAVALIQGVDSHQVCQNSTLNSTDIDPSIDSSPYFSTKSFFLFLFFVLGSSTFAFWFLEYLPAARHQRVPVFAKVRQESTPSPDQFTASDKILSELTSSDSFPTNRQIRETIDPLSDLPGITTSIKIYLFVLLGLICLGGNGFLPGIQSYSCLPYGIVAYHLTVTLAHLSNPVACVLALWFPLPGPRGIAGVATLALLAASHVTYLAFSSPTPPWRDSTFGVVFVVFAWILLMGLITYAKLAITAIFRRQPGDRSLFYVGIVTQAGSAIGALFSFGLINYSNLLVSYTACVSPP